MEALLESIELSAETENWNSAIALSLMIPDICPALAGVPQGRARYLDWFRDHALSRFSIINSYINIALLSAEECYAMRCSILHAGTDELSVDKKNPNLSKIIFTTTGSSFVRIDDVLIIHPADFAHRMCASARGWIATVSGDSDIQDRMKKMTKVEDSVFSPIPGVYIE